jgi:hypothetical protein
MRLHDHADKPRCAEQLAQGEDELPRVDLARTVPSDALVVGIAGAQRGQLIARCHH